MAVARGRDLVVIRVVGRGNMLNAPAVQEFAEEQRKAGFTQFLFDMERCSGLDSTFMGVMVGLQQAVVEAPAHESGDLIAMTPEEAVAAMSQTKTGPIGKAPRASENVKEGGVSAVNVSAELLELLKMLGVDNFIKIRGAYDLSKLESTILPEKNMSPTERSELIYAAHRLLVEIDKRNEAQFGELLKSLELELRK